MRPDPRVFRRRRIVVLTILLVLVGGIVYGSIAVKNWLFPGEETPEVQEEPTGPTVEDLANPRDCEVGALETAIELVADSLPAGRATALPITVTNVGDLPCLIDVGEAALNVEITSGDDPVWSSRHCEQDLPSSRRLLLDIGARDTTVLTWPGTRSAPGCPDDQPLAKPGTYRVHLTISVGTQEVQVERVFGLE